MTVDAGQDRIDVYRERLAAAPESRAFAPLADALRQAGQYAEALSLLEEGLVRHPRFVAAQVILGHTLLDAGRVEHACRVLRAVLAEDAENVVALRLLTEECRSRQSWQEVIPLLEKLAELEPDDTRWRPALAEARLNRTVSDPGDVPETSFATMTLVEIYLAQGYRAKAMAALRQILASEPGREDVKAKIAEIGIVEAPSGRPKPQPTGPDQTPEKRREQVRRSEALATKRTLEKRNFENWIARIRNDENAAP